MSALLPRPSASLALLLGGAQSGKTAFAVAVARACEALIGPTGEAAGVCFVGTARADGDAGAELGARLDALRRDRPAHWITCEPSREAPDVLAFLEALRADTASRRPSCVVFDCATLWLAWELSRDFSKYSAGQLMQHLEAQGAHFASVLGALVKAGIPTLVVSNETGSGVVPGTLSGRLFRDALGLLNTRLADASTLVVQMVAGQPLCLREGVASPDDDVPIRRMGAARVARVLAGDMGPPPFPSSTPFRNASTSESPA